MTRMAGVGRRPAPATMSAARLSVPRGSSAQRTWRAVRDAGVRYPPVRQWGGHRGDGRAAMEKG